MSLTVRVLIGLVAGFILGLLLAGGSPSTAARIVAIAGPVGTIFVNLIRMTVVPFVTSLVIASIGSMAAPGKLGRIGMTAIALALVILAAAAIGSALIAKPAFARINLDQSAALALGAPASTASSASTPHAGVPTLESWLVDLVPQNVIKAAADGAMLPLMLFAAGFGLALAHVSSPKREAVLRVVEGIAEAMQRLVGWVLDASPIGVFALAITLASRLGLAAAGAVIAYVALVVILSIAAILLMYPLGILGGRMAPALFASYCAPPQAIAFASRSSLATLPVMLSSAERVGLAAGPARVLLPLALAVFHVGAAVAQTVGVIFLARLFGVTLGAGELASIVVTVVLTSFAVPGIPGGSIIAMVPVLAAAHVPLEGVGILLAVDTIPDMFRTTANVTGALTLTAMLAPSE